MLNKWSLVALIDDISQYSSLETTYRFLKDEKERKNMKANVKIARNEIIKLFEILWKELEDARKNK